MKNKLLLLLKARTFQIFLLLLPNLQQNNNDNSTISHFHWTCYPPGKTLP